MRRTGETEKWVAGGEGEEGAPFRHRDNAFCPSMWPPHTQPGDHPHLPGEISELNLSWHHSRDKATQGADINRFQRPGQGWRTGSGHLSMGAAKDQGSFLPGKGQWSLRPWPLSSRCPQHSAPHSSPRTSLRHPWAWDSGRLL